MFDSLADERGEVRQELNDCCFVYDLKQSGIPEDVINKINLIITSRYLSLNKIDKLCTNNLINCVYTYIEEGNGKKHM